MNATDINFGNAIAALNTLTAKAKREIAEADEKMAKDFLEAFQWGYVENKALYTYVANWCATVEQHTKQQGQEKAFVYNLNALVLSYTGFKQMESTSPTSNRLSLLENKAKKIMLTAFADHSVHPLLEIVTGQDTFFKVAKP